MFKNIVIWAIVMAVSFSFFKSFLPDRFEPMSLSYSELIGEVQSGGVLEVEMSGQEVSGVLDNQTRFSTTVPNNDNGVLMDTMLRSGVKITAVPPERASLLQQLLIQAFPVVLLVLLFVYFMRQMQSPNGRGALNFGKSRARLMSEDSISITFDDVAGVEEAKEEVSELVEFLRDPKKFQRLGGKIPRGVLLIGSPGTGKTLLAKAIAGESKVPFFSISGSDFVEMFVGIGASRVRDMFEQARRHSPCIIFIDEIDAVGRHRGSGMGGGHDEREQTLNQLLVEMDGFDGHEGIIVIAATNRPDVLDKALLRPGRFDRQVIVPLPDILGREQILKVHLKNLKLGTNINPRVIARGTPGFSGADLTNLTNEAALLAARAGKSEVSMAELDKAKDKVMMGAERRSMVMTEHEKKLTAYHEAGHAIVGLRVPQHDPVYKVTIIPRGRALGVTMFLPEEDRHSLTRERLESSISSLYGGRLAEELIFGDENVTTGASNDIERATGLARNMVVHWGLSEKLGPLYFGQDESEQQSMGIHMKMQSHSDVTSRKIDEEVSGIISRNYDRARQILVDHMPQLHRMAESLIKYETIGSKQIALIMQDKDPGEPEEWADIPPSGGEPVQETTSASASAPVGDAGDAGDASDVGETGATTPPTPPVGASGAAGHPRQSS
ncbi:MAG: ATP-dependent zinc metalloprotease FtsH [Gammaproteobacteria bacterium]|nr:ATP-dependent zinc metalloprotease FtsH [Pseudomonadota bacterium]MCH9662925.1 ATP-dependent zinc metalloprotease FtsH [Gammaproteobacteria bacterium]